MWKDGNFIGYSKKKEIKMQTKLQSAIESGVNILIGYLVALASQLIVFPQFGINIPLTDNLLIGFWFTVISLIRSYLVRRYFNKRHSNVD